MDSNDMELVLLRRVFACAKNVSAWVYKHEDEQASDAIRSLDRAVEDTLKFIEIKESAEAAEQASRMRNAYR